MKRALRIVMAGILVLPLIFSACTKPDIKGLWIVAFFSWPTIYINEGGTVDIGDWEQPIKGGTFVDDATVTVTNTTTGESLELTWYPPGEHHPVGYYAPGDQEFAHTAGQSVSVQIEAQGTTYNGTPTVTSDAFSTITAPEYYSSVTQPFNLTWTIDEETTAATHVVVYVRNFSTDPYIMQTYLLPITTTTQQISGFDVADNYYLSVFPVNRMPINGGGKSNFAYVGSTSSYRSNSLMVNFTAGGGN